MAVRVAEEKGVAAKEKKRREKASVVAGRKQEKGLWAQRRN